MKLLQRVLSGAVLTGIAITAASATTIDSQSAIVTFNTDNTYTLTLPKFNVANATLNSATLYFFAGEDVSVINFSNTASTAQTFDANASSNLVFGSTNTANNADRFTGETLDLFDTGIGPGTAQLPTVQQPITLGAFTGTTINCPQGMPSSSCNAVAYTPPDEIVKNTDSVYALPVGTGFGGLTGVVKSITGSDLLNYIGASTFSLTGATKGLTTFSGGGNNIAFNINTAATFQAEIDYNYTTNSATPEPTTMILFGSGLLGLGLLRKRIKS